MATENIDEGRPFRVLVIDDVVCRGKRNLCDEIVQSATCIQDAIRNYFASLVDESIYDVYVDFVDTPEEGVAKWQNEIYDLTLIDSDFQKSPTVRTEDKDKRSFLDLDVEFIGAYLYRFLHEMLERDQREESLHFRDGCKLVLWTGLNAYNPKDEKDPMARAVKLFSILGDSLTEHSFIPKGNAVEWENLINLSEFRSQIKWSVTNRVASIKDAFEDVIALSQKLGMKSRLARVISWYQTLSPEDFRRGVGLPLPISRGWISCDGRGKISLGKNSTQCLYLSPSLRKAGKSIAEHLNSCLTHPDLAEDRLWKECRLLRPASPIKSRNALVAAATPLTGCSAVGEDRAISLLSQKIAALLDGPFEQVVLKTVYLDSLEQWDCLHWPCLQAQSHHRTRCLRSTKNPRTLWNTGITALESFTPKMMGDFLVRFQSVKAKDQLSARVIVSLGSKFPQHNLNALGQEKSRLLKKYRCPGEQFELACNELKADVKQIWKELFETVFVNKSNSMVGDMQYQMVEINVRHYLRECIAYHVGGHEYLSPSTIDEKNQKAFPGCYADLDREFNIWLEVLNEVAASYNKKLLLKLPFRGDVLHWVRLIRDVSNTERGAQIAGITLINAFKSGAGETTKGGIYTPAWYGVPESWGDAYGRQWTYQMSGEALTASRNELLGEVFSLVANSNLEVHVSGGIVDIKGIRYCSPAIIRTENCVGCGVCVRECKANAISIVNIRQDEAGANLKKAKVAPLACKSCGECIDKCRRKAIIRPRIQIGSWALMDLNLGDQSWNACAKTPPAIGVGKPHVDRDRCQKCEPCCVKCTNGAFERTGSACAEINYARCVNCKDCVDQCVHGAIAIGNTVGSSELLDGKAVKFNVSDRQLINSRIAFCLHELCNGCGKCSRTFYCDTFMDRRGLDLPPVMDSRNCTGCGLCVQTCPRGAIQLFAPKHVVVLIGTGENLSVWHRRLMAYEIPHLVFRQEEIVEYYSKCEEGSHSQDMKTMFTYRKDTDRFFDKLSKDYIDDRCWDDNLKEVLNKTKDISIIQKWLFLAWSDPGQVLKDSPVIYAINAEEHYYFDNSQDTPVCGLLLTDVLAHPGMSLIRTEVNNRLRNLREVR